MTASDVAAQLTTELGSVARAVGAVLGVDILAPIELRIDDAAARLAAELGSDDDWVAADAARTVMDARWPDDTDPPPRWWRTPVGRLVARSVGGDTADAVTHSVAAAILGVTTGTVAQMMGRAKNGTGGSGGLERHPDGGITRASVLARIATRT